MNTYDVFFEIYGKKMKATVEAENRSDAKYEIEGKIIFHEIRLISGKEPDYSKPISNQDMSIDALKSMFGMK